MRIEQWEAANPALPWQEGMIIAIPPNEDVVVEQEQDTTSGASRSFDGNRRVNRAIKCPHQEQYYSNNKSMTRKKKRRSRRSPRQVSEARLDAKVEQEDLNQCYKAAFKQARTLLMLTHCMMSRLHQSSSN